MTTVSMVFTKSVIVASVETMLWKYGMAIENPENYKKVFNTQSDSKNNTVDMRMVSDSWDSRTKEAFGLLKDFNPTVSEQPQGVTNVSIVMPARWIGKTNVLKDALDRYITDGMMADWLSVTAPDESAIYANRLQQDVTKINVELYSKGAPQ